MLPVRTYNERRVESLKIQNPRALFVRQKSCGTQRTEARNFVLKTFNILRANRKTPCFWVSIFGSVT